MFDTAGLEAAFPEMITAFGAAVDQVVGDGWLGMIDGAMVAGLFTPPAG